MQRFVDTRDMAVLDTASENIVLFHPYVPESAIHELQTTLKSRWIGQGPKVERFEREFARKLGLSASAVAVGACTDALHLSYILAGLKEGDEVITTVFTCTATNIPLLYMNVDIKFADIQPNTLNIDPNHVRELITDRTRAIVCVHYGGLPCDIRQLREIADERGIPIIEDAAQALGATYQGVPIGDLSEFTAFSFQAIKHITTGDGGMLTLRDESLVEKVKRIRWFGIDRSAKQGGYWENDIREVGYKYQMTDVAACLGLAALDEFDRLLEQRRSLFREYETLLSGVDGLSFFGGAFTDREHAAWLCTVAVENRRNLERKLREHKIESGQVHFRNDRYTVFERFRTTDVPNMDALEDRYLVLPLHNHMDLEDVRKVCEVIRSGW